MRNELQYLFQIFKEIQVVLVNIKNHTEFRKEMKKAIGIFAGFCQENLEFPTLIFPPIAFKMPPTEIVGSSSPARRMWDSMDVVVVFPWVPEMAIGIS